MKGFISQQQHPFVVILLLLAFILGGVSVASFIYYVTGEPLFGVSLLELERALRNPVEFPEGRNAIMYYQGLVSLFMFVLAPLALVMALGMNLGNYLNWKERPLFLLLLLSGFLVVMIMPLNSVVINWNAHLHFPEYMRGFEEWARAKETEAGELTKMFAQFKTVPQLLVGLLVIAVIPAVGEELLFRGIVQQQLHRWWGNGHVAVWVAAAVFSAIHVQFFGFIPRMVLGALFGYLYWWSGRISVPIVAHFVNNGFTVFVLYLQQTGRIDLDIESTDPMPIYSVLISALLSAGLLYYLYQQFKQVPLRIQPVRHADDVPKQE